MIPEIPKVGGMVGFADGRIGFCNACGWRGVPTYLGGEPKRILRWVKRGGEWVPLYRRRPRAQGQPTTYCPACQHDSDVLPPRHRARPGTKAKRKAQRAARRRNR